MGQNWEMLGAERIKRDLADYREGLGRDFGIGDLLKVYEIKALGEVASVLRDIRDKGKAGDNLFP